mgnify:CR=1|tara:strand:+ start:2626 stop:2865 length:240 start_codon:yes stop_codon:yes gene_type:complete
MSKNKYKPMKNLDFTSNPAITDIRDERASQDRKLLRMEAFKTTAMVLGANKETTMSEIINESNKVYAFLENGTTQPIKK